MTDVAAIYFPSWHCDPRRDAYLGDGFTEWSLIKAGRPRFAGHHQPLVPSWGYIDETEPETMTKILDTAAASGIDAFLWDWYWYADDDFLNRPLNDTYLNLPERPVRFALMWANHTWRDVFPADAGKIGPTWWPGEVDADEFARMTEVVIERYLKHPSYWHVDGRAWFTIFSLETFVQGIGGIAEAARALEAFRVAARAAGAGELHLNTLGGFPQYEPDDFVALGLDSVGNYGWGDYMPLDRGMQIDYAWWRADAEARRERDAASHRLPFVANVTMGWDATTRVNQEQEPVLTGWPHMPVVVDNTPQQFGFAMRKALEFAGRPGSVPAVIVNAWNEWTEGSYLEPEERTGYGYLSELSDAVRAARPAESAGTAD